MIRRERRLKTSADDVLTRGGGGTRDEDGDQQLDMFKACLACESVHESFDVVISKVWLHCRHVGRSYRVYKRDQLRLKIRCPDMTCSYRIIAKRGQGIRYNNGGSKKKSKKSKIESKVVWLTTSCLDHSCDITSSNSSRLRQPKSSIALVAANTILPLMLGGTAIQHDADFEDNEGRYRAAESLLNLLDDGDDGGDDVNEKIRVDDEGVVMDRMLQRLLHSWRKDLASGGTNNAMRLGGIKRIASAQHEVRPLDKDAVVVDVGSGAGFACCFYALRYGCTVYGIEKSQRLVDISRHYAQQAGVSHLCTFYAMNFNQLTPGWFHQRGVTHILAFDGVFAARDWNYLFHNVFGCLHLSGKNDKDKDNIVVGASVSKFSRYWPSCLSKHGDTIPSVGLSGSQSSFSFSIWSTRHHSLYTGGDGQDTGVKNEVVELDTMSVGLFCHDGRCESSS